ncbi:MAG TPA: AsmA-like C-terminal region-containing protein, partial [Cytophagales bacterium]|nr:AsmA-like C-terminal region-containing protein [Cytophagales bacterium]
TFNTVKAFAPIAQNIDGNFSTTVQLNGKLKNDMMPALETLNGDGILTTTNSKFKGSSVTAKLAEVSKLSNVKEMNLNDIKLLFEITNGRVNLKKPLDFMAGGNKFTMTGSQGIDGTLDYLLKTQLPIGSVSQFLPAVTKLTGKKDTDKMDVAFKVSGESASPKVVPVAGDGKSLDEYAKDQAKAAIEAKRKQAEDSLRRAGDKARADLEAKLRARQDSIKKAADAKIKAEQERLKKEAEDKLKNKAKDKLKDIKF